MPSGTSRYYALEGQVHTTRSTRGFDCPKHLTLNCEVGGKACESPPVAEEANRVWRSGRLFARIRTEKDGNRKRKRDTAHDAVGSSGAGGAIQALLRQCFFVARNT